MRYINDGADYDEALERRCGDCDGRHQGRCPYREGAAEELARLDALDQIDFENERQGHALLAQQASIGAAVAHALMGNGCAACAVAADGECDACFYEKARAAGFEVPQ
jgi:hypothetical protein